MGTRNKERYVSSVACNLEKKALETDDDLGTSTYEGKLGTSRRVTRWTMKEGGWGSFNLKEGEFAYLEKKDKGWGSQNGGSEKPL